MSLADGIAEIAALGPDVLGIFHSRIGETAAALQVMLDQWSGPIVVYPDAGREDYLETWQDSSVANEQTVAELTREAAGWVEMGAQIIGTCCGFGAEYTRALRGALPDQLSSPRNGA
jgi:S-methylmethionine-dependent homocysteine/selenocysteine methylase